MVIVLESHYGEKP